MLLFLMFRGKKLIEEVENPPTDAKERIELGLFDNSDDHVSQRIKKKKKKKQRGFVFHFC